MSNQKINQSIQKTKKNILIIAISIILLLSLLYGNYFVDAVAKKLFKPLLNHTNSIKDLAIHYLDVGQGDSTLIIFPNNETVLIDAGYETAGKKIVHYLQDQNVSKIKYLIATHTDSDHIGGMRKVISKFKIENFCMPATITITSELESILNQLERQNTKIHSIRSGDSLTIDPHISFIALSPIRKFYSDANQYSIVLSLVYKKTSFLFLGDATEDNEKEILGKYPKLKTNILKAGHHGSDSSTSKLFIQKTQPQAVIISCGYKNDYAHPGKRVMKLLKDNNISVYRTDEQKHVVVYSNGKQISVNHKSPGSYAPGKKFKK